MCRPEGHHIERGCESRHPRNAFHDIMVASCHHGSSSRKEKRVSISNHHHHHHRLTTMTTTTCDSDHEDQDDIMRGDDSPPHLSHPGTENPENPDEFHTFCRHSLSLGRPTICPLQPWHVPYVQKNPRAHKNKIGTPPPPKPKIPPPPKNEEFYGHGFFLAERTHFSRRP